MFSRNAIADASPAPRVRSRADALRASFPEVATAIDLRRAPKLDSGMVADFVALGWLRWEAGALVVTAAGSRTTSK